MIRPTAIPKACVPVLLLIPMFAAPPALAGNAQDAFETLKSFEGTWKGTAPEASHEEGISELVHEFRSSANGSVVMETMNPGTPHEMINMYHLEGDDLVLIHYCSAGNQPKMKLSQGSGTEHMVFEFAGGTNIDEKEGHFIHDAELKLEAGVLHSSWRSWDSGKLNDDTVTFVLKRD